MTAASLVLAGVLAGLVGAAAPARADDGRPLLAPVSAARPQPPQSGTPLVPPTPPTSTTTTTTVMFGANGGPTGGAGANGGKNDLLCRNKLKLVAQLEREKARALTLLARATDRLDRAKGTSRPAVVAAFQKEVDSNEARVDEIQDQLDALRLRCS